MMPFQDAVATAALPPSPVLPPFDPLGLPGPHLLLVALLNTMLALHFVFMGYIFTTALLHVFLSLARPGSLGEWMLRRTEKPLPIMVSLTITFGVAPLLLVQVLYQPVFYSSNILIGYQWFGIVPVLTIASYLIYALWGGRFLGHAIPRFIAAPLRLFIFASFAYVLLTLTTNSLLMLHPEGFRLIHDRGLAALLEIEPVFIPRLLHNVLAALIIGGVWHLTLGQWRMRRRGAPLDFEGGRGLARLGAMIAGAALAGQMLVGLWLIVAEKPEVRAMLFSTRTAAMMWMLSLAFVLGLAMLCMMAVVVTEARGLVPAAWAGLLYILISMFSARQASREVRLAPTVDVAQWPTAVQQSPMILFFVLLAAGFAVVGVGLWWVWRGSQTDQLAAALANSTTPFQT